MLAHIILSVIDINQYTGQVAQPAHQQVINNQAGIFLHLANLPYVRKSNKVNLYAISYNTTIVLSEHLSGIVN